jgi:hypothetical protein
MNSSEPDHAASWLVQEQENRLRSRIAGGLERSDKKNETGQDLYVFQVSGQSSTARGHRCSL